MKAQASAAQGAAKEGAAAKQRSYPPAPWELYGQAQMHLLLVKTARLQNLPAWFRPLSLAGRSLLIAGFIDYERGSILSYGELFAAPIGFVGAHHAPTATVTHMWVDSQISMEGGRELWGYPKQLASFQIEKLPLGAASAADDAGEIAAGSLGRSFGLPRAIRGTGGTVQPLAGQLIAVRAGYRMIPSLGRGRFNANPDGPLAHLSDARLVCSLGLRDFHFTFGL